MKINILGTKYNLIVDSSSNNPKLRGAAAYVELWSKKIVLTPYRPTDETIEQVELYAAKVVRHEIVHAFFHESGLDQYCNDERLVDWIAHHLPNLNQVCQTAEQSVVAKLIQNPM